MHRSEDVGPTQLVSSFSKIVSDYIAYAKVVFKPSGSTVQVGEARWVPPHPGCVNVNTDRADLGGYIGVQYTPILKNIKSYKVERPDLSNNRSLRYTRKKLWRVDFKH